MPAPITVLDPAHMRGGDKKQQMEMWIQEAMYGHRFTDEQRPFMLVLEALAICRGRWLDRDRGVEMFPGLKDGEHERIHSYVIAQRALRFLLFYRVIDEAAGDPDAPGGPRLDRLIENLERRYPGKSSPGFGYLRGRSGGDPDALLQAVRIVRGSEINPDNNKRAQSRFLNPQGPALHLTELNNDMSSNDRRFFARGGELVYLMLNRSRHREDLAKAIAAKLFEGDNPFDRLARLLAPEEADEKLYTEIGYLPAAWMPLYDRLAEDWLAILDRKLLPRSQVLGPLSSITALHMVRYFAEVGEARFGIPAKPIPLDMSDGALKDVQGLGKMMLTQHQEAIRQATRTFIDDTLEKDDDWRSCRDEPHPDPAVRSDKARDAVEAAFRMAFKTDRDRQLTGEEWREEAVGLSLSRKRGNPSTVVKPLGEKGGFVSTRQRAGTWFAASDAFLEALVHANVGNTPFELEELAARLHERYGIVIGPAEAAAHLAGMSVNTASYRRNFLHLEERLAALGLLKRLSDDCAFVFNPFAEIDQ